jgi:hypothetical protein
MVNSSYESSLSGNLLAKFRQAQLLKN